MAIQEQNDVSFYQKDGVFILVGKLVFSTVSSLIAKSALFIDKSDMQSNKIIINCSQITHIDSAGIALFLDWKRKAAKEKKDIEFEMLPKQAKLLIHAAHLNEILAVDDL